LSFGGYGLALAALALVVIGAIECPPERRALKLPQMIIKDIPALPNGQVYRKIQNAC